MSSEFNFDDLMPVFLEEAREHVDNLTVALVALESGTAAPDVYEEMFRAAHSLKGMSGSMSFTNLTELTHVLEDVLGVLRDSGTAPSHDLISILLRACDTASTLVDEIEQTGAESAQVAAICSSLREIATQPQQLSPSPGDQVMEVRLDISERSLMPAARAFAALLALEQLGTCISTSPDRSELESGAFSGTTFTVHLATTADEETLRAVAATPEIEAVAVTHRSPDTAEGDQESGSALSTDSHRLARSRSVKVEARRLDDLMHGVGELLVRRSHVVALARGQQDPMLAASVEALDRAAQQLQQLVMDVRMVSIESVLRMMPRVVRDLADELGKEVNLTMSGRSTELDRTVIDALGDPLLHLVRNAIDHGIESPEEREQRGKPRSGYLDIAASSTGGSVVIRVRDDGGGIDPAAVRARAVQRGVLSTSEAATISDEAAIDLCFSPGFSTRDSSTAISGRGVGLDVVRASVRSLGGDVHVESSDEGTLFTIRLPLTLAIRPVLLVASQGHQYAFHTDRIGQTLDLRHQKIHWIGGRPTLLHLDAVVPLVDLDHLLGIADADQPVATDGFAVIVEGTRGAIGVRVHQVVGQTDVVTRGMPESVRSSSLIAASAVLGDGTVALILDSDQIHETVMGLREEPHAA